MLSKVVLLYLFAACDGLVPWWPMYYYWSAESNSTCPSIPGSKVQCVLETHCPEHDMVKHSNTTVPCQGAAGDNDVDADGVCCTTPTEMTYNHLAESEMPRAAALVNTWHSRPGNWPWMAAIGYRDWKSRGRWTQWWNCAGTLINVRFVITAAHCIHPDISYLVRLGESNFNENDTVYQDIWVEDIIIHPGNVSFHHDLALLRLTRPAKLSQWVQLVNYEAGVFDLSGATVKVAGWGATNGKETFYDLREAEVQVINSYTCERIIREKYSNSMSLYPAGFEPVKKLCHQHFHRKGGDICNGDSGGPVIYMHGDMPILVGVISAYISRCGVMSVSVRVGAYSDWIFDTMYSSYYNQFRYNNNTI